MVMKRFIVFLSVFISVIASANTDFDEGVRFANQNKLDSAILSFETVIAQEPQNASAFYNLGYCYFQQQKYGEAIWGFEKALQYDPTHANSLKNLEICHFKLDLPSYDPIQSSLMRSLYAFGADNWSILAIICSVLAAFSILLIVLLKTMITKRIALISLFFFSCFGISSIYFAYASNHAYTQTNAAIVTGKKIPTYLTASGEKSPITLTEGTRISDLEQINKEYYQGILLNGQEVMIDSEDWRKL